MRPIVISLPLLFLMVGGCQNEESVRSVAANEAVRIYSEMMAVETINVSKSLGPYSAARRVGGFLFISGQVGIDPATGQLNSGGFEAETEQAMENVGNVLTAAGYSFSDVIKSTVYLKDIDDYGTMNAVYGRYFTEGAYPSRVTVGISNLPARARVEISVVAYKQVLSSG